MQQVGAIRGANLVFSPKDLNEHADRKKRIAILQIVKVRYVQDMIKPKKGTPKYYFQLNLLIDFKYDAQEEITS